MPDHFSRFDLPTTFSLDRDELERAYLSRASQVHPDRFVTKGLAEQRTAMEQSAALNEAYRVLRDPVRRAEYLCKLAGIDLDSSDREGGAPHMDQAFLIEMIERREAIDAARQRGEAALAALRDAVEVEADAALDDAVAALGRDDAAEAARFLVKRRYLARLVEEIEGQELR